MEQVAIFGSTGSIGRQSLDVMSGLKTKFRLRSLAAGNNTDLLEQQISKFSPDHFYAKSNRLPKKVNNSLFKEVYEMASDTENDVAVVAVDGMGGLQITLKALESGTRVALANKESILIGGHNLTEIATKKGVPILPIDSEPSAIWQCIEENTDCPAEILITASGGPFFNTPYEELSKVTPLQATAHPRWSMGKKISVDSSNLVNKAFEVIEAHILFKIPYDKIKVVVHRQSVLHGAVKFSDGQMKALLSPPDMRFAIGYALTYPERPKREDKLGVGEWSIDDFETLTFESLKPKDFPCFEVALEYGKLGGTWRAALVGADQAAVELFLANKISYNGILKILETTLKGHDGSSECGIEDAFDTCQKTYNYVLRKWGE